MSFKITGQIREKESGLGVPDLKIRAYDKDLLYDDLLGTTTTDGEGRFEIEYFEQDFRELFEGEPEVYLTVYAPERRLLLRHDAGVAWQADGEQRVLIEIDRQTLGDAAPAPPEGAPQLAEAVLKRKAIAAREPLPKVMVEVGRIWHGQEKEQRPVARQIEVEGGTATVLEVPFTMQEVEPPQLRYEALDRQKLGEVAIAQELEGHFPAHLALNFRPNLIEPLIRQLREGEDLPNAVFAPDSRYIFNDSSFPWCTTGKVETSGGSCTGTMIGRRLMLTGSHCMQWTNGGAGWVKFTPAYYNGAAPFGVAWGTRVIYWNQAEGGLSDFETAFDYVVIVLDRNMGDLTGYAGYRTYSSSWNGGSYWQQIGYPGDLSGAERPAFFGGGSISTVQTESTSGQTGYVMGHFMDTAPGHSGGPYWGWWGDEPWPRVVGTDSASPNTPGTGTSGDNEAGGGPALSALISYARSNYP